MSTSTTMSVSDAIDAAKAGQRVVPPRGANSGVPIEVGELIDFWKKFVQFVPHRPLGNNACWEWQGGVDGNGYGCLRWQGRVTKAHRWVVTHTRGRLRPGELVRHSCDNRKCVRPSHLKTGTAADNRQDAVDRKRARGGNSYKSECTHGHPFDEKNTYTRSNGERSCRTCHRQTEQRRRDRMATA